MPVLWTICQHVVINCIGAIYYLTKDLICRQVYRRQLGRRKQGSKVSMECKVIYEKVIVGYFDIFQNA